MGLLGTRSVAAFPVVCAEAPAAADAAKTNAHSAFLTLDDMSKSNLP
jgi:hypothetical protein